MSPEEIKEELKHISKLALDGIGHASEIMHDNGGSPDVKIGSLEQVIRGTCLRLDNLQGMMEGNDEGK